MKLSGESHDRHDGSAATRARPARHGGPGRWRKPALDLGYRPPVQPRADRATGGRRPAGLGRFLYGERLCQVGAFGTLGAAGPPSPLLRRVHRLLTLGLNRLPSRCKRQLALWHAAVVLPLAFAAVVGEYRRFSRT